MATSEKKADFDPNFQDQVEELQTQAYDEDYEKRKKGEGVQWAMPKKGDWDGDLFDWDGITDVFKRERANADFKSATESSSSPGRSGDLIISTTQIALLSLMERAFRARHTYRWPRAVAQMLARRRGHGKSKTGMMARVYTEYLKGLIKGTSGKD